jgi:hypothetical protein
MTIALYIAAAVVMAVESLYFAWPKQGLSQVSGRRVLRIIGHSVLSVSRRCLGAPVRDGLC